MTTTQLINDLVLRQNVIFEQSRHLDEVQLEDQYILLA